MRPLAVTGLTRSPALPNVPTVDESGVPGYEVTSWYGVFVKKDTPDDVKAKLVAAFKKEGIYSTISPYWGSHTENEASWELGFEGGSLTGLKFFYEPVQQMYKAWLRRLFTEPTPTRAFR